MTPRSEKEYSVGIPLSEETGKGPLLSRSHIEELRQEGQRAGYSLRAYISILLRQYACQDPKGRGNH